MAQEIQAIDVLIIPGTRRVERPEAQESLARLFPGLKEREAAEVTPDALVAAMDEAGVEKGILSIQTPDDKTWVMDIVKRYPYRFIPTMVVNPVAWGIMDEVRRIRQYVAECNIQMFRLGAWRTSLPINDRYFFPFYALAAELDLKVMVNIGLPGPIAPGWIQDPLLVDEICFLFPELKIIQKSTGMPWVETACNNVIKWPNCYLATPSYRPKYFSPVLIQHLNTRAQDKIMWGTEYPLIPFKTALEDIRELPLRDLVRPKFLRENALKLFKWP